MDPSEVPDGLLLADKPAGPTSHDVVRSVRGVLGGSRVGHGGTLDPFATGLLLLLVGRATRLAEYVSALDKTYDATLRLGAASSTGDPHGEIKTLHPSPEPPAEDALREALQSFVGESEQVPPAFSAKRVGGERAYRMARRGEAVTLAPARVRIERIELQAYQYPHVRLRVTTGPGVYIRGLARDLGVRLGSAAYVAALRRDSIGPFQAVEAADPANISDAELIRRLLPPESAVAHLPALTLGEAGALALAYGQRLPACAFEAPPGQVRLLGPGGFLGVGSLEPTDLRGVKILYPERAAG